MTKRQFRFEISDQAGKVLRRQSKRCTAVSAPMQAAGFLDRHPEAAAVYAYDASGLSVHSAYRSR